MKHSNDNITTEIEVTSGAPAAIKPARSEDEEVGTSVTTVRSELEHEDDKNVLSVFINAISVRIKMPRGTVKALMLCFAVLIFVGVVALANVIREWSASYYESAEYQKRVEAAKDGIVEGMEHFSEIGTVIMPEQEIQVGAEYAYVIPAGSVEVASDLYGKSFLDAIGHSSFAPNGFEILIRSYTMEGDASTFEKDVLDRLNDAYDVRDISREYQTVNGINVLACSYLIDERDGEDGDYEQGKYSGDGTDGPAYAVEYSWVDDYNTICSVEVSSLSKYNHKVAELVRDTIHKIDAKEKAGDDSGNETHMDYQDAWNQQQMEDSMNSLAEDAMNEYYREEPDISDHVLKP